MPINMFLVKPPSINLMDDYEKTELLDQCDPYMGLPVNYLDYCPKTFDWGDYYGD